MGARNGFLQFDAELLVFATRGVEASANRAVVPPVGCADVCLGHGHLEARLAQVFLGERIEPVDVRTSHISISACDILAACAVGAGHYPIE